MNTMNRMCSILLGVTMSFNTWALHDKSSECGTGHEGWKQDCSGTPNIGAPVDDIGSGYSGLIILSIYLLFKKYNSTKSNEK